MTEQNPRKHPNNTDRRQFLKTGTAATLGTVALGLGVSQAAYAGENNTLKVGLIGCGGRGTGAAAQALRADPNTELVALGDAFADHLESSLSNLQKQDIGPRVKVDDDHKFVGFDAYKQVIEACDVVVLTTPPHFRPAHFKAAVEAGKHAFVEKPVAVDAPGVKSILATSELAKQKNLSVVSGLCWRYHHGMQATFDQIHDGGIGDIVAMQCSYNTRGLWKFPRKPGWSDMEYQMRNWLYYTWLSGDFNTEQHVHSLDKMAWAMQDQYPLACSGTGGRQTRTEEIYGHIYDHFAIVYEYENGVKGFSRCRQQDGCAVDVSDHMFGSKGKADVFAHQLSDHKGETLWKLKRRRGVPDNMYQNEHDEFFKSIRSGNPINNGNYMAKSTMMAIMGRMAAYTGQKITWDQAMNSQLDLSPKAYEWGELPTPEIAQPGKTKFV